MHQRSTMHRDLKTANIFMTDEYTCKVGDFGASRMMQSTNQRGDTQYGTINYLPPEVFLDEQPNSQKSDIWTLGCILYNLCTFEHPFQTDNYEVLRSKLEKYEYEPILGYSEDLRSLVDKLLTKIP